MLLLLEALAIPLVVVILNSVGRWLMGKAQSAGADLASAMLVLSMLMIVHAKDANAFAKSLHAPGTRSAVVAEVSEEPLLANSSGEPNVSNSKEIGQAVFTIWYIVMLFVNAGLWVWSVGRIEPGLEVAHAVPPVIPMIELVACSVIGLYLNTFPFTSNVLG